MGRSSPCWNGGEGKGKCSHVRYIGKVVIGIFLYFCRFNSSHKHSCLVQNPTSVHYSPVQSSSAKSQNLPFTSLALVVKTDVPGSDEEVRLLDRFLSTEFIIRRKQLVESNGDVQVEAVIKQLEKVSQTSRLWWGKPSGFGKTTRGCYSNSKKLKGDELYVGYRSARCIFIGRLVVRTRWKHRGHVATECRKNR